MSTDERKIYAKVMGIEEARKQHIPMPSSIKIPKGSRLSSSGGHCGKCGHETMEGHEDGHGIWHYKCTYCIEHADPKNPDPCPRCKCTAHEEFSIVKSFGFHKKTITNPFKPEIEEYRCLNCGFEWTAPEFEKYMLVKVVRSVLPSSAFNGDKK